MDRKDRAYTMNKQSMDECEWDKIAKKWDNATRNGNWFHKYLIYPSILEILGNPEGQKILDVGCGNGHLSYMLHSKGALVTGIDKSEEMIQVCRQNYSYIRFLKMDITKTTDIQSTYDIAIFNNSLQDMEQYQDAIINTRKLLKINGSIIIIIKHPCFHPRLQGNGWKIAFESDGRCSMTGYGLTSLLEEKEKYKGVYFTMDNYYSNAPHCREWYGESTTSFTRTLEEYFHAIISAGFTIGEILEPRPKPDGEIEHKYLYNLLTRIPNFLVIYAKRRF